jgi:hypothetical protein
MKYHISKKRLKSGESLHVAMSMNYIHMQNTMSVYDTTPEETFKLIMECNEEYIDFHFNYGYSITNIKTILLEEPSYCKEYRCRIEITKL